jgi:flagellar biogenesis protein FliO
MEVNILSFFITLTLVLLGIGVGIYLVIRLMKYFDKKNRY